MSVHFSKDLGQYNFAGTSKEWHLQLVTPYGRVHALFDIDEEPDTEGLLPSDVLDLIEARTKHWWISTSREETLKKIAAIREHASEIDLAWLETKAERMRKELTRVENQIYDLREGLAEAHQTPAERSAS